MFRKIKMKKMNKNKLTPMILVLTVLILSSCSHRFLDFTLISSKNVDFSKATTFERGKDRVEGKDMVRWIIVFPTGTVNVKEALDRAIESTPGCVALLDGVIYMKFWYIPYIYGMQSATVEGTPLIDPSLAFNSTGMPTFGKIELNKNGEIKSVESISNTEYYALKDKIVKESKITRFKNSTETE
jgi:hypothetical protein